MEVVCPHCREAFDLPVSNPVEVIDAMGAAVGRMMFPVQQMPQEVVVDDTGTDLVEEPYDPWMELAKDEAAATVNGDGDAGA